jgi:hypothetical protein
MVSKVPVRFTLEDMALHRKLGKLGKLGKLAVAGLIFVVCFLVFRHAPIPQAGGDDRYSMLLAENLLRHRDVILDRYDLPSPDYRLESVAGHRYYRFPPGTSVLSVPYVALMHLRGKSVLRDGSYSLEEEIGLEARLAALLMAGFAVVIYLTAQLLLPARWSLVVTFASAFGTQVFSTTSRAMWSDTWGVFLVGLAVFEVFRSAVRGKSPNLPLLATIEVLAYVVRPTNSLVLIGTTIYLILTMRRAAWPFLVAVGVWLTSFLAYSWRHFHRVVPSYFEARRLAFGIGWSALWGNLNVPLVVAIAMLLLRYRRTVRFQAVLALSVFVICGHLAVLAGFEHWWGGHCFGARLTSGLVPWISILAILAIDAFCQARSQDESGQDGTVFLAIAGVLSILSVAINSLGAFSQETSNWNVNPDIDETPSRLWSWRRPQFLAPFLEPAGPFPRLPADGLRMGVDETGSYLGLGWSGPEGDSRWTNGSHATLRFSLAAPGPGVLEIEARPYLGGGKIAGQRLVVTMNGKTLQSPTIRQPEFARYEVAVPADILLPENRLRFELPDASSPMKEEKAGDRRELGVCVRMVRWRGGGASNGSAARDSGTAARPQNR